MDREGLDVKRWSERIMVLRVVVGRSVVNLVSVYAPQSGRGKEEKEEFFTVLGKILSDIDAGERLLICGDMNGHVGADVMVSKVFMVGMVLENGTWMERCCWNLRTHWTLLL